MKEISQPDENTLELVNEPGIIALFVGLVILGIGAGVVHSNLAQESGLSVYLLAGGFGLFGLAFCLGSLSRRTILFDRVKNQMVDKWGMKKPFSTAMLFETQSAASLDRASHVLLRKKVRRTNKNTTTHYPVTLEGGLGTMASLDSSTDYGRSRNLAEAVARFLDIPLHDESSGKTIIRQGSEVDAGLREQARNKGEWVRHPQATAQMKTRVEHHAGSVKIIVSKGMTAGNLFALGMAIFAGFFFFAAFGPYGIAGGAALALLVWLGSRKKVVITVSSRELAVSQPFLLFRSTRRIPAKEVEELFIQGAVTAGPTGLEGMGQLRTSLFPGRFSVIIARSDRASIRISSTVGVKEMEYIRDLIRYHLVR